MKSIGEISIASPVRAGFREFSSRWSGKKGSRRRLSIATRRESRDRLSPLAALRLDLGQMLASRAADRHGRWPNMISNRVTSKGKRPFPTVLRKTLRRYWGARASSAWLSLASAQMHRICRGLAAAGKRASPSGKIHFSRPSRMVAISTISFGRAGKHEGRGQGSSRTAVRPLDAGAGGQRRCRLNGAARRGTPPSGSGYCRSRDQSHGMTAIRSSSS